MKNLLALGVILLACATGHARQCYMELLPPGGLVMYPLQKFQMNDPAPAPWWGAAPPRTCTIYIYMKKEKHLNLVFRNVNLGKHTIKVYTASARAINAWSRQLTIKGSRKEQVLEISSVVGVKISVKMNEGRFLLFYQEYDCGVPDPYIVERVSCTDYYMTKSECDFRCRAPNYLPLEPGKSFNVICREDGTWTWKVEDFCVKWRELLEMCYGYGRTCEYTPDVLSRLIPEDSHIPTTHEDFAVLESAAQIQHLRKHAPKDGIEPDFVPNFDACNTVCLKSRATDTYLFECKSPGLKWRQKKDCLRCRYTGTGCHGYILYL